MVQTETKGDELTWIRCFWPKKDNLNDKRDQTSDFLFVFGAQNDPKGTESGFKERDST